MKIYIDGLFYKGSGIGRYYESLTKELSKRGITIYTCVPQRLKSNFEADFKDYMDNIVPIYVDYEKFSIKGFIKQAEILNALSKKVSLFFFPHVNLPYSVPGVLITTIHDLRPLTKYWDRSIFKKMVFRHYLYRAIKKSNYIVTISETVKNTILESIPVKSSNIKTIYEFVDNKFLFNKSENRIIGENYILYVGNRKKHKNLGNLVKAFNIVKNKINCKLVIAGSKDRKIDEVDLLKKKFNLEDKIIEIYSPNDEVIVNLYQNAELFVFPSLYEGFGLPPLEAIACGTPSIASNIPVLREVLGQDIACFDPLDPNDIANKILNALEKDEIRQRLLKAGREILARYNKDKIIDEYIALFEEAICENSPYI